MLCQGKNKKKKSAPTRKDLTVQFLIFPGFKTPRCGGKNVGT
jgi:hypothetical protein